ncbi:MAG TPA: ribonuclease D [Thermoanaerobaculia bacterium]|jgi:ribonuclease D
MASLPAIDPAAARPPATAQPVYVDAPDALADACARWRGADVLGIDTEFVRERTFYPGLGLIQVTDGDAVALVDPVALGDLCPLERVFADEGIVKVLHSCSEDMEVFFHRFGALPRPVFDTQVAAAFLGLGYSPGYSALVEALFGVEIPKHLTRTNWLRRPLSADQKRYAALDVAHLLPCYDVLSEGLRRCGRDAWAAEEFAQLVDAGRFDVDPRTVFRGIRRSRGLDRRQLAVLRELAAWREEEARRRDLPRNFVLREAVLPDLARRPPRTPQELAAVDGLRPEDVRRYGRAVLDAIGRALELPEDELPERLPRPLDLSPYQKEVDAMRRAVAATAEELGLPPELLATRRTVEKTARRVLAGKERPLPRELRGWRRAVVGERLLELAASLGGL